MYLEAVTVCVDYSDILALTIPYNKSVIDNWVIVTSTAGELPTHARGDGLGFKGQHFNHR